MTALDPRWVVRHGVRYWEGGAFPEPADYELTQHTADPDALTTCGKRRGTMAGARRHYRAKEPVCADCRAGERAHGRTKSMTKKCANCDAKITSRAARCTACWCKLLVQRTQGRAAKTERKAA